MACVISMQVQLSVYILLNTHKMLVTCQHSNIQAFSRLRTHNLGLLTCSINHPVTRRNREVAEEAVAYITNLIKISLPDGKSLVGM